MNLTATVLTALAAGLTLAAAIWRLIVKLGKNATTWELVRVQFQPDHGTSLVDRVASIEGHYTTINERLASIERKLPT